jgi:PIN domain nuclease of toxin-antitoxin system
MKLLLDTQVFLWFISADVRLPLAWRNMISDRTNAAFLSVVSIWEAVIKAQLGKLPLPEAAGVYLPRQRENHGIASLPIDEASVAHLADLPLLHRDPFDRMLVCQALRHDLVIMTADDAIRAYPVRVVSGA